MRSIIGSAGSLAIAAILVFACGGDDKRVVAPSPDAAAGTPVQTAAGGQVGVVDSAGTSGLEGSAKSAYEKGWQAWLNGDLQNAKKGFQEAQSLAPKSPAPPYSLGIVQERLGDLSGAQQSYRAAFTANPEHEISMCAYALSLAHAGHGGEADIFLKEKL